MNKRNRSFFVLKTLLIAALALSAAYIAFAVPEAAETFMPIVGTTKVESCEYKPTVIAKGTILKQGENFFAVTAVNEADISQIEIGQSVLLSGAAFPNGGYSGTVSAISDNAYVSALSSVYAVETVVDVTVLIDEGDTSKLRSGYSVTAQLRTGEERVLNMLPYSAVCQDENGEYVYVLENNTAVRRDIVTGIELSDKTEIVSGVSAGELIALKPDMVVDGGKVRIRSGV